MKQRRPALAALSEAYLDERLELGHLTVRQLVLKYTTLVGIGKIRGFVQSLKNLGYSKNPTTLHFTATKLVVFIRGCGSDRAPRAFATLYEFGDWLAFNGYVKENPLRRVDRKRLLRWR